MEAFASITIGAAFAALYLGVIVFAIVQIYRRPELSELEKAVWIVTAGRSDRGCSIVSGQAPCPRGHLGRMTVLADGLAAR